MKTTSLRKDLKRVFLPFWFGSAKWRGYGWMATLLLFLIAIGFINIGISYSERAVFNSLEVKKRCRFLEKSVYLRGCTGYECTCGRLFRLDQNKLECAGGGG